MHLPPDMDAESSRGREVTHPLNGSVSAGLVSVHWGGAAPAGHESCDAVHAAHSLGDSIVGYSIPINFSGKPSPGGVGVFELSDWLPAAGPPYLSSTKSGHGVGVTLVGRRLVPGDPFLGGSGF
jgi:hypothetical protein